MFRRRVVRIAGLVFGLLATGYLLLSLLFFTQQRRLIYLPSHLPTSPVLAPWTVDGKLYGYSLPAESPKAIWLILQGNGGQAGLRDYFKRVAPQQSLYLLEYPGYGRREGEPTRDSVNAAASAAYRALRLRFPGLPVNVVGESFGSGPATRLAREAVPPDSFVLIVPVARFDLVMRRFVPVVPVRLLLRDNWDNLDSLRDYRGPVTIFAAEKDEVIPLEQTLLLAGHVPQARLVLVPGGHLQASESESVKLPPAAN
jgi:pimeloyl-ACP methyl ester carboxylesterase